MTQQIKIKPDFWMKLDIWMSKRVLPVRIFYDSLRVFLLEHSPIRATALAYTSLLAVVPLLILLTSISLSLGIGDLFIKNLPVYLPEILEKITPYIDRILNLFLPGSNIEVNAITGIILENIMPFLNKAIGIRLDSLGVIGAVGLLVTFILMIDSIETNMNIVWGVNETRGYLQKAMVFIPFLLLFAGGIGIFSMFIRYMRDIIKSILVLGEFGSILVNMTIPTSLLFLMLFALWLLYCYMPYVPEKGGFFIAGVKKTKERGLPALISAVFAFAAASVFIFAMGILQASMFAKWSLFYGSLAVFPMIMFLLFGFWCIVLFGNALCWRITDRKHSKTRFLSKIRKLSRH